jgi:hypothetical protein
MAGDRNGSGNGGAPPASAPIPEFPRDVTHSEEELGFSLIEIPSLQAPDEVVSAITGVTFPRPVVAMVLNSFEILVKINGLRLGAWSVMYEHKEFGYFLKTESPKEAKWHNIGYPRESAAIYLQEMKSGIAEHPNERPAEIFKRLSFKYRPA